MTPNVRKANTMLEFQANLSYTQQNVFALTLNKLNQKILEQPKDENGNSVLLSETNLFVDIDFHEVQQIMSAEMKQGRDKKLRQELVKLKKESQIIRIHNSDNGLMEEDYYSLYRKITVSEKRGYIRFRFEEDLFKDFLEDQYFLYHLDDYIALKSTHSRTLFEVLQRHYYRTKKNNVFGYTWKPAVEELYQYFGITEASVYHEFKHFNNLLLKKAIKEINKHTELHVEQKNVKRGRYVRWVEFHITRNEDFRKIDEPMQQDIYGGGTPPREIPNPPKEYYEWVEEVEKRGK